jgi:hypothetical protein
MLSASAGNDQYSNFVLSFLTPAKMFHFDTT